MNLRLIAENRTSFGKGSVGRIRKKGWVPGILYGKEAGNQAIQLEEKELEKVIAAQGLGALVEVQVGSGKPYAALFREIQHDPVRGTLLHCDLYQVPLTSTIQTTVPVTLEGEAIGIKNGGVFQPGLREIEVECIASQIPEEIQADISHLDVGDALKIKDIPSIDGIKIISDPETVLASVIAPRLIEEEETTEAEAQVTHEAQEGQEEPKEE